MTTIQTKMAEVKDLGDGRGRGLYMTADCDAGVLLIDELPLGK